MNSSTPAALPMQVLALTAISAGATKHSRANKFLSTITIVFLLAVALGLGMLAWWPLARDSSPHAPVESESRIDKPLSLVNKPQVPLVAIELPPPPVTRDRPVEKNSAATAIRQPSEATALKPAFKSIPVQPKPTKAVKPGERFASLKPQLIPSTLVPVSAATASAPAQISEEPSSTSPERPIRPIAENQSDTSPPAGPDRANESIVANVATTIAEGRALLRILEHGKGPSIEIAWPRSKSQRLRLFSLLTQCYGLQAGVVAADEAAYVLNPGNGKVSPLDLDRTSGFVRVVSGAPVPNEAAAFRRLRRSVANPSAATPVRTFPRRFDALLLGGLQVIAGNAYANGTAIRATYKIEDKRLLVSGISIDGSRRAGAIDLTPSGRCVG